MSIFSIAIAGCKKEVAVTGVTVSPTTVSLHQGGTQQLTATVQPANATNKTVAWSSGNTARATVSDAGLVTIPANATAGEVAITVTTADGGFTANCTVTVSIVVTGITIAPSGDVLVEAGKTATLTATVAPANATNKNVTWSSLATGVATVDAQTGVVTGVSAGMATIRATAADGSGVTADKSVTVTAAQLSKTVAVDAQNGTLTAGVAGTVTFPVTTSNIANGTYAATVANRPSGVTVQGNLTITAGNGTLILAGNTSTNAGSTSTLTLTIDGVTSQSFTLTIVEIQKSVTVGTQNGTLTANRANTVIFPVTTNNIANGRTGMVTWYSDAAGSNAASAPTGITASVSNVASNAATVTINTTAAVVEGTYYFRVTIDGELSNVATSAVSGTDSPWNIGHPGYNSNVKATLTGNTLTISGTGNMVDFWCSAEGEAPWWFDVSYRDAIKTVIIENGVQNIGMRAFKDCSNMETITISSSITKINAQAFYGCSNLQMIKIPNSVATIEGDAFFNCSKLSKVEIENGSNSLQFIGYRSSNPCATSGTINKYDWFSGCSSLTEIHLGRNLSTWSASTSASSPISNIRESLTNLTIGSTVTSIGANAFTNCRILVNITIQDGLDNLASNANSFTDCPVQTLHYGRNMLAASFRGKTALTSLSIGNNVTSIIANAFNGCSGITDVVIPNSVTSMGSSAFYGCSDLKGIVIGSGIKTIESSTFYGCSKLTSIIIPSTVTSIGANAFTNCRSLVNVIIEDGLNDLEFYNSGNSFTDCPIQTLHLGRNMIRSSFGSLTSPFRDNPVLTSLTIGNNVTSIMANAFNGCTGITDIILPNNVTSVESSAFYGCSELKSIVIGNGIKSIENSTFYGCSKLTSITIPNTVTYIDANVFTNCRSLANVIIEDGLNDLAFYNNGNSFTDCPIQTLHLGRNMIRSSFGTLTSPFRDNPVLTSLTIGNNITSLLADAFQDCTGLTRITSNPSIPPTLQSNTFTGVPKNIPVRVPNSSIGSYRGAQYWMAFTNFQGF